MKTYQTQNRTVQAEQLTEAAAQAYIEWHMRNANLDDESKDFDSAPKLPDGVRYTESSGFALNAPAQPTQRMSVGDYVVGVGRDARVEKRAAFEAAYAEPASVVDTATAIDKRLSKQVVEQAEREGFDTAAVAPFVPVPRDLHPEALAGAPTEPAAAPKPIEPPKPSLTKRFTTRPTTGGKR